MKLGHVNIRAGAGGVLDILRDLLAVARQIGGDDAFRMPARAAALHEAGHAVVYAAEGHEVQQVRIFELRGTHRGCWSGKCDAGEPWVITPATPPSDLLAHARILVAGRAAEALYAGRDFAAGSSLDEVALAVSLVARAAAKLGREPEAVLRETVERVGEMLREHGAAVRAIADALMREGRVRGSKLARLLLGEPQTPGQL